MRLRYAYVWQAFVVVCVALCLTTTALAAPIVHLYQPQIPSSQVLQRGFQQALVARHLTAPERATATAQFGKLPAGLKYAVLGKLSPPKAAQLSTQVRIKGGLRGPVKPIQLPFQVNSIWPNPAQCGTFAYVLGFHFLGPCTVSLDGTPLTTYFLDLPPDMRQSLWFQVPAGTTPRDTDHNLIVTNTANHTSTPVFQAKIIAFRGYRGLYGWQFNNWESGQCPWYLYRDYFGSAFVGSSPSNSTQAALDGYYNFYEHAGSGGNCFGMSVSSLRTKLGHLTTYWHSWFASNPMPFLWDYPWGQQTRETAMEDQGGQFAQEFLDAHLYNYNHQTPQGVWNRVHQLLGTSSTNPPILLMWGHGWGHTIVPWETRIVGNDHQIICWDNNHPYAEGENGDGMQEICHIDWSTGAISYEDGYNFPLTPKHFVCMSYQECTPAHPHMTTVGYSNSPWSCVVGSAPGTHVAQITDERGHTFFLRNGDVNENPATRIPNSAPVFPMVAIPSLASASKGPTLFTFNPARGKSLTFQTAGRRGAASHLTFCIAGSVYDLQAAGTGQIRFLNVLGNNCRLEIPNPAALRPTALEIIRTVGGAEHTFRIRNLTGLGTQPFVATPSADGKSLHIQARPGAKFNLNLLGRIGAGQASFNGVASPTGHSVIALENWQSPRTSALSLQVLNAAGGLQRQMHLAPGR